MNLIPAAKTTLADPPEKVNTSFAIPGNTRIQEFSVEYLTELENNINSSGSFTLF